MREVYRHARAYILANLGCWCLFSRGLQPTDLLGGPGGKPPPLLLRAAEALGLGMSLSKTPDPQISRTIGA